LLQLLSVHPAIVVVLFLLYGAFHHKLLGKWKTARKKEGARSSWNG
jgi:chromate transporter